VAPRPEHVEQHQHPLTPGHCGAQAEVVAERTAEDSHPSSDPQPAQLDRTVALTSADVVDPGVD
jgi:hypothetical protein